MKKDSQAAVATQKSATKKPKSSTTRKTRTSTKKTDKTPKSLEESTPAIKNQEKEATQIAPKESRSDKVAKTFAEMIIERMEAMKNSDWKQTWLPNYHASALPQNISGRPYNGYNTLFLQMDTARNNHSMPVYMTFHQISEQGAKVNRGAKSMPVVFWDVHFKDKDGNRIPNDVVQNMSREEQKELKSVGMMRVYNVFNIDNTNIKEIKPDLYQSLLDKFKPEDGIKYDAAGMYSNKALDRMFERQEWVCPIHISAKNDEAFYSVKKDAIELPAKAKFKLGNSEDSIYRGGMEFYSTAIHEMCHSTGIESRLNRMSPSKFGGEEYAKEELVAELTAAMVGSTMGFDSKVVDNNAKYVNYWIKALQEEPQFILSVMADVNKASTLLFKEIDKQRIALGEQPYIAASPTPPANGKELEQKYDEFRKSVDDKSIHIHLFRAGSFLEAYKADASKLSDATGVTLTSRMIGMDDNKITLPLAGFRQSSLDKYLAIIAEKGMKVAIHEDLGLGNPERMKKMGIQENKLDDISFNNMKLSDGKSIDKFAVFKTKYGNYSMRAIVDGQQMPSVSLNRQDKAGFFDKTISKAELVQKYYKTQLNGTNSLSNHKTKSRTV